MYEVPTYVYTYSRLSEEGSRSHPLVASAIPVEEVESDRVVRTGLWVPGVEDLRATQRVEARPLPVRSYQVQVPVMVSISVHSRGSNRQRYVSVQYP